MISDTGYGMPDIRYGNRRLEAGEGILDFGCWMFDND
jgi:hypothetical protein